jgi:hypothetical protein
MRWIDCLFISWIKYSDESLMRIVDQNVFLNFVIWTKNENVFV